MPQTFDLEALAEKLLNEKGLLPEFSREALEQLKAIKEPSRLPTFAQDLRDLLWCSIDNDDSRDLDQLTFARKETEDAFTLWIAVADVDALVPKDSPLDMHAKNNTSSIYTPAKIFPMLPEKLSTDLTSLNENEDRAAIVVKISINAQGEIIDSSIFQALVRNKAKLIYYSVGAWLEGKGKMPERVKRVSGLEEALRCQHEAAQKLKTRRHAMGALTFETLEAEAKLTSDQEVTLDLPTHNASDELIEHFMIAANHVMASYFVKLKIPSIRRIVRLPKNWDRIVEIAGGFGETLPEKPDPKALDQFLVRRKKMDPETFPDLSLTVIKLLGRGEYIVEGPEDAPSGHFGLALSEYTHSTAPNRRFPDLISQRQFKACFTKQPNPYSLEDLKHLADHCTVQEDVVMKIERQMTKAAAAMLLQPQIGSIFQGIVTGAGPKGTWVRIFSPPIEGKVLKGFEHLEVGDKTSVKLVSVDIPRGYINFVRDNRL